jgi:hypothetical protein
VLRVPVKPARRGDVDLHPRMRCRVRVVTDRHLVLVLGRARVMVLRSGRSTTGKRRRTDPPIREPPPAQPCQ